MKVKHILGIIFIVLLVAVLCISIYQTVSSDKSINDKYAYTGLISDYGYVDYAKEAKFDYEKDPELETMGLFWLTWDENTKTLKRVHADTTEGAKLIDTSKPTLIMVHGMQVDIGRYNVIDFNLTTLAASPSELGLDLDYVPMMYLWLKNGWNIGEYHYDKFASNLSPAAIEEKVWSTSTEDGVKYQKKDGSWSDSLPFTVAEYFVGDYLRAMNLLPSTMGEQEIRVAGHSMGGQVTAAGLFLLSQMVEDGQLQNKCMPDRYAMMDTYFGASVSTGSTQVKVGVSNFNVRWSGKPLYENDTGAAMVECIRILANEYNVACEYYVNSKSFLKMAMDKHNIAFRELCAYTLIQPSWESYGNGYNELINGHNGNMEWYLCSIVSKSIKTADGKSAPSASLSTEKLREMKGKQYKLVGGMNTVTASDDVMRQVYYVKYNLNGGVFGLGSLYPEYFDMAVDTDLKIVKPTRQGYVFVGFYDNPKFEGKAIQNINAANMEKTLYAKWEKQD